jgi:DNA-binding response OmpR family regulator
MLVIADDADLAHSVRKGLQEERYAVDVATDLAPDTVRPDVEARVVVVWTDLGDPTQLSESMGSTSGWY